MTMEKSAEEIQVVHAIPGRIRLKVARVRTNPALAQEIQVRLAAVRGISRVEVNPITASVLVIYEAREGIAPDSLAALTESLSTIFPSFDFKTLQKGNYRPLTVQTQRPP